MVWLSRRLLVLKTRHSIIGRKVYLKMANLGQQDFAPKRASKDV
jgi:hypothetical protein